MEGTNEMNSDDGLVIALILILSIAIIFSATMGHGAGYERGLTIRENEAVNRGYASFVVDSKTRTITFQWKEQTK